MENVNEKANQILEVILAYAKLNFSEKLPIERDGDVFDAISSGVNMLGEELEGNVISLQEKEQLLKEIHHRVKNNMQIISSLLSLQFSDEKDERVVNLIRESQNRISAMALVHEILYATSNFKQINFRDYIDVLTQSLFRSYAPNEHNIDLKIQIPESVGLEMEKIIPLGLVLNEIITNSLKYAFPTQKGMIEIIVENLDLGGYKLLIQDNGIGLPGNFDMDEDANLGMQLIYMLGKQIDAKIDKTESKGVGYIINFKS